MTDNIDDIKKEDSDKETKDKEIFIVPTSHASEKSEKDVKDAIDYVEPDVVGLELDARRFKRFENENLQKISERSFLDIIKESKNIGLKGRIILIVFSLMQSKVASKLGMDILGLDMKSGYEYARKNNITIALVDKDIQDTFNDLTDQISKKELIKTVFGFIIAYIQITISSEEEMSQYEDIEESDIETAVNSMETHFPALKRVLIDQRNEYIAENMINIGKENDRCLAVVGAAHKPGLSEIIEESDEVELRNLFELEEYSYNN